MEPLTNDQKIKLMELASLLGMDERGHRQKADKAIADYQAMINAINAHVKAS